MKYPLIYKMIKQAGHSPAKAATIILDATRGDVWAREWIVSLFHWRGNNK